jgi:hypothetical protein
MEANGSTDNYAALQTTASRCRTKYVAVWAKLQARSSLAGSSCVGPRFTDNGPTVTDNWTGLQWEKKTSLDDVPNLADRQDADNNYTWTATGTVGDGSAFAGFLAPLNSSCFAGRCDWRLPTRDELQTILSQPFPCISGPCLDPVFGPTQDGRGEGSYWTASTYGAVPGQAWVVSFHDGTLDVADKAVMTHVRAVSGAF